MRPLHDGGIKRQLTDYNLPDSVSQISANSSFPELDPRREQALNSIGFVWNTVTAMWDERFRRLSEWKRIHGHCAVPIAQGELGTWVSKQRQLKKRDKLTQEKIDALDSLGFTWSTAEADWEDKFKRLCQWAKERGHASVPFNEGELGWWVNTQRQCKRKGKLSPTREARLRSLGFIWNPSNSRNRNSHAASTSVDSTAGTSPDRYEKSTESSDGGHVITADSRDAALAALPHNYEAFTEHLESSIEETSPEAQTEGLLSPVPVTPSQNLWSPIEIASPILPLSFFQGLTTANGNVTFPLQLQPSVQQTVLPFSHAASLQTHSDALEQLLSRNDPGTEPDLQS